MKFRYIIIYLTVVIITLHAQEVDLNTIRNLDTSDPTNVDSHETEERDVLNINLQDVNLDDVKNKVINTADDVFNTINDALTTKDDNNLSVIDKIKIFFNIMFQYFKDLAHDVKPSERESYNTMGDNVTAKVDSFFNSTYIFMYKGVQQMKNALAVIGIGSGSNEEGHDEAADFLTQAIDLSKDVLQKAELHVNGDGSSSNSQTELQLDGSHEQDNSVVHSGDLQDIQ